MRQDALTLVTVTSLPTVYPLRHRCPSTPHPPSTLDRNSTKRVVWNGQISSPWLVSKQIVSTRMWQVEESFTPLGCPAREVVPAHRNESLSNVRPRLRLVQVVVLARGYRKRFPRPREVVWPLQNVGRKGTLRVPSSQKWFSDRDSDTSREGTFGVLRTLYKVGSRCTGDKDPILRTTVSSNTVTTLLHREESPPLQGQEGSSSGVTPSSDGVCLGTGWRTEFKRRLQLLSSLRDFTVDLLPRDLPYVVTGD